MFVDRLIDTILRPFREITSLFTRANQAKVSVQMDVNRVRNAPQMVRNEMNMAVQPLVQTGNEARAWRGGVNTPQPPANAMVVAQQPEKKKDELVALEQKPAFAVLRSCIRPGTSAPTVAKVRVLPSEPGRFLVLPGCARSAGSPGYPPAPACPMASQERRWGGTHAHARHADEDHRHGRGRDQRAALGDRRSL